MFPPLVIPALSYSVELSTRQTPAVLPRSRKTPASSGAGYGPGPPPQQRLHSLQSGKF